MSTVKFQFKTKAQRRLIPAGVYEAEFAGFQTKGSRAGFQFLIDGQGSAWQWISDTESAEGVLRQTLRAIGAQVPDEEGESEVDLEACFGQPVMLRITHDLREGTTWDNVKSVWQRPDDRTDSVPDEG